MRDPKRIPQILKRLEKLWEKYPDLRLCQLILNCFPTNTDLYYLEDKELVKLLENWYAVRCSKKV